MINLEKKEFDEFHEYLYNTSVGTQNSRQHQHIRRVVTLDTSYLQQNIVKPLNIMIMIMMICNITQECVIIVGAFFLFSNNTLRCLYKSRKGMIIR